MNAPHPANSVFRAIVGIARAQCSEHRRDSEGWPLGNCVECVEYRKKMDAWHMAEVMNGNHDPDLIDENAGLDSEAGAA